MPSRWRQEPHSISRTEELSVDALGDLNTTDEKISTWYVGNRSEEEVRKAVLAFASGFPSVDSIYVVFIDDKVLESEGFEIKETPGETKIQQFAYLHRDISGLRISSFHRLAMIELGQIWNEEIKMISADQICIWLLQALNDNLMMFDDLNRGVRDILASKAMKLKRNKSFALGELRPDVLEAISRHTEKVKANSRPRCKLEGSCDRYKR